MRSRLPSPSLCPSQKGEDVTAPPVALNRCALRLAGHQSPRQVVRDGTALLKGCMAGALSNLLIACRFSAIFLVVSIKKRIFFADI